MFEIKTMEDCKKLIDETIGLENSPAALNFVDDKTDGAWSKHIDELGERMGTFPYFLSTNIRNEVHTWHYNQLVKFIKLYQDVKNENIISKSQGPQTRSEG